MNREQQTSGASPAITPSRPNPGSSQGGALLASLADFETRITALKFLHEQTVSREAEVAAREAATARREAEADERERALSARLVKVEAELSRVQVEAEEAARERAEVEATARAVQERERALEQERARVEAEFARVRSEAEAAERTRAEIERAARERAEQQRAIESQRASVEAAAAEAREAAMAAQRDRSEVEQARQAMAAREQALATERSRVQSEREQARSEAAAAVQIQSEVERSRQELAKREAALAAQRERLEAELASARAAFDAAKQQQAENQQRAGEIASQEQAVVAQSGRIEAEQKRMIAERQETERVRTETERMMAEVAAREQNILAERASAEESAKRARAERAEAERLLADSQEARQEAQERERVLAQERSRAEADGAQREQELAQREGELREREFDIKAQNDELERERASVAEHARTLAAQLKAKDDESSAAIWSNRVETMQMEIGEANAQRARVETELAQVRKEMNSLHGELLEANKGRGVPVDEVERRDRSIAELTVRVQEFEATVRALQQRLETSAGAAAQAEEAHAREIAMRDQRLWTATQESAEKLRRMDEELAAAKELLEQAEMTAKESVPAAKLSERDAMIADLQASLQEAAQAAAELRKTQAETSEAAIDELRQRLEQAEGRSAAAAKGGDAQTRALQEQIVQRDEQIAELKLSVSRAEAATAEASAPSMIEERDRTIAELRAQVEELLTKPVPTDGTEVTDELEAQIAQRDEAITLLRGRLDEATAREAELREQAQTEQAQSAARAEGAEPRVSRNFDRRKERLRQYKALLRDQARKIMAAQSALQRRHADCEIVLTNRARLAELAQQLARAEKKISAGKARHGAATAMLYMVITLALLAGASWEISKRVWPGTYIAQAVLEADVGRRTPKAEDLAAWQRDHEEMLSDPRLIEVAAERMQRRGLTSVGTPADLAARLKSDMYVQKSKNGSLTVELRGEGAERTALVLDTLVTSFKTVSDQGRDERSNDIGVNIAQAATPGTEPLMDKRMERAGGVFGGAALAVGLAGLVIWTRLVKAKKKFDHAAAVEAAMGEVDWGTLEASIRKHSGKSGPDKA